MEDDQQQSFGEQLRQRRQAAGLTQEELAARAGLTAKGIAALERGRRQRPYPHTVAALADALGLTGAARDSFVGATQQRAAAVTAPRPDRPPLPALPTTFLGREAEITALGELLRDGVRLLTLIGPGGVGKTRLALAVAQAHGNLFADGAAFVGLAPLANPALVLPAIAAALGLREEGNRPARELVQAHLAPQRLLLVIDNCEHLLDAVPDLAALLAACPRLTILATSRAPLRLRGEREWAVPPLALPDLVRLPTLADLAGNTAVELFVARGRDVAPDFALTQANAAAVAAICRRLDGLPLAIELAAARLRSLTPTELLARLDRSLPLLAGGARDLPARQRTMRDAIAWSYDLLNEGEKALFRRLAVFARGWDLAAAESVASALPTATPVDTLETLGSLVEQSLVLAYALADGTTRYRLLAGVREFAREQLAQHGELDEAQRRHAEHYLALAERAAPELSGPALTTWTERLEREHDNVRMALPWALANGRLDIATRLGWSLQIFWATRGHHGEGLRWMEAALASEGLSTLEEARALAAAGLLVRMQGDFALATERLQAALDRFRTLDDRPSVLVTLSRLGQAARFQGDYARATAAAQEGLALARELGDQERIVWMLDVLGIVALAQADYANAASTFAESLTLSERTGDARYVAGTSAHLAVAALGQDRPAEATDYARRALQLAMSLGLQRGIAQSLDALASVAAHQGQAEHAARLFGAAEQLRTINGLAQWSPHEHLLYDRYLLLARESLGAANFAQARAAGRALTAPEAYALALADDPAAA